MLHLRPEVAHDVILDLSRLQGVVDADPGPSCNEEERGRIHHEHRSLYIGGRRISARSQQLLEELSALWGGDGTALTYYGSIDATPLFVRLVARYCALHGRSLLHERLVRRDGAATTVRECVLAALDWIARRMDASRLGMAVQLHDHLDRKPKPGRAVELAGDVPDVDRVCPHPEHPPWRRGGGTCMA